MAHGTPHVVAYTAPKAKSKYPIVNTPFWKVLYSEKY